MLILPRPTPTWTPLARPAVAGHHRRDAGPARPVTARVEGEPIAEASPVTADRLTEYLGHYQSVFQRADQFERFGLYLRGLLAPGERKNVEAIAAAAADAERGQSDLAQALQHFISQSPWDAGKLLAAYRKTLAARPHDPEAVWVVHDGVFPKKGRHSVGVQRQFARAAGRKLNCQMAVVVSRVGPGGYHPLAARLYLPAYWLQEHRELAERMIPGEHRQPAAKFEIALKLIDELRAEAGAALEIVAEEGYATLPGFVDGLTARQLTARPANVSLVAEAHRQFDDLRLALGRVDLNHSPNWQRSPHSDWPR